LCTCEFKSFWGVCSDCVCAHVRACQLLLERSGVVLE